MAQWKPDAAPECRPLAAREELPEENCRKRWSSKSSGFPQELFRASQGTAQTSDMYSSSLRAQSLGQGTSQLH